MGTKGEWRGAPASYSRCRKFKDWIEECKLIRQRAHAGLVRNYWNDSVTIRFYREILTMNTDMERMRKQSPYLLFSRKKREGKVGCTFSGSNASFLSPPRTQSLGYLSTYRDLASVAA